MTVQEHIDKCLLSLDVGGKNALLIVLSKDGTICRHGNGNPNANLETLKGYSDAGHFEAFMMTVTDQLIGYAGYYEQQPIVGQTCQLIIALNGPDGAEVNYKCVYGADSQGPPAELAEMLINAVKITEGWYNEEREKLKIQAVNTTVEKKKWWQIF